MRSQTINSQQPRYYIAGLTLIEMMLVVTIIAVATLTGVKILKNRTQMSVINNVAAQMQNVGQSVMTYYMTNHNQWPTSSTVPSSLNSMAKPNAQQVTYISVQALCSPFPGNNNSQLCKNFNEIQGQVVTNAQYYNIVLTTDSNETALTIAGKLANAVSSGNTVIMSIIPPAQYFLWNPNKGWIVSSGVTSFTTSTGSHGSVGSEVSGHIYIPNCPSGFEGHVMFFPERYETAGFSNMYWGIHMAQVTANGSGGKNDGSLSSNPQNSVIYQTNQTDSHGNIAYAVTVGDQPDSNVTSVQHLAFYMTFCLPIGHWGTNYINTDWPQDGQCSGSWMTLLRMANVNYNAQCVVTNSWSQRVVGSPNGY